MIFSLPGLAYAGGTKLSLSIFTGAAWLFYFKKGEDRPVQTLIAYSSTHGAAAECARRIAEKMEGGAETLDLKKGAADPALFGRVILGSSIYGGQVQREVTAFCKKYGAILLRKPLGVYFCCISEDRTEVRGYLEKAFPPEMVSHLTAFGALGGAFYFTKMNFLERGVTKYVIKRVSQSQGRPMPCDGRTDFVALSDEKIEEFAGRMNASGGAGAGPDEN